LGYKGLARKWRPQVFSDLVGQESISTTLSNAIKTGRISHGYLFTGTRGVGKTSAARIFAKALRCPTPLELHISCNACKDCQDISEGKSLNVLEIDGASNNGVDAVREIRENVKYMPSTGKYKIYIVDEVHMLTTAAFNALLKTLEEPPPHVVFIFATTDPQKIPATVLSRCQRFDFKRLSQKQMQERLSHISNAENIAVTKEALSLLSRQADGSMRDALSLLDQAVSNIQGSLTEEVVVKALGLIDKQVLLDCISGILKRQPLVALDAASKIHLYGFDLKIFSREVLRYLRTVLILQVCATQKENFDFSLLDISESDQEDLQPFLGIRSNEDLDMLFRLLNMGLEEVMRSSIPKVVLDMLLIKMASAEELLSLNEIEELPLAQESLAVSSTQSENTTQDSQTFSWSGVLDFVKAQKPLLGSILEHMSFSSLTQTNSVWVLSLEYSLNNVFYKEQLEVSQQNKTLKDLLCQYLHGPVGIVFQEVSISKIQETEKQKADILEQKKQVLLRSDPLRVTENLLGARLEKLEIKESKESIV